MNIAIALLLLALMRPVCETNPVDMKGPSVITGSNATITRLKHYFADEEGRWNGNKPYVVRSPIDLTYGAGDQSEYFQARYGIKATGMDIQDAVFVAAVLDSLPRAHVRGIAAIAIQEDYGESVGGYYFAADHSIHLCRSYFLNREYTVFPDRVNIELYILLHEIGHSYWFAHPKIQKPFTDLVKINPVENFAKFYAWYLLWNAEMKLQHPDLWRWYGRNIFV